MALASKKEADVYDKIMDAAADLAELIESSGIHLDEAALEALTIFLASNAPMLRGFFAPLKRDWP